MPGRPPLALVAWYAAATGALSLGPWIGLLLEDAGLTSAQATALLVLMPLGRLIGGPGWAWVADRVGPEPVLRGASVAAAVLGGALLLVHSPLAVALVVLGWVLTRAPLFPIVDAATVERVGRGYGRVRSVGSAAFLVCVALGGALRDHWLRAPVALAALLMAVAAVVTFSLPRATRAPTAPALGDLGRLLVHPVLLPLMGVCVLHGATLSSYDQLFAMHVHSLGLPASTTGAALAVGVGVEVVLLAFAPSILARMEPRTLLAIAVGAGVPRFWLMGTVEAPALLIAVQALHGLHFGAFWVAGTAMFAEEAPPALRNSTQALFPAAGFAAGPMLGLGLGAVVLRYTDIATLYLGMAGVSALALGLLLATRNRTAGHQGPAARGPGEP